MIEVFSMGEFDALCNQRSVLNEIIIEIIGVVLTHNPLSENGRRSQNSKWANLDS
jgi:hypothetical protein